jgi:zinc D-Ala-D-Ala carboxypeptidase
VSFSPQEFACKCGKCGKGFAEMQPTLLSKLNQARQLAGVPFVITSAYRCEEHNRRVGGTPNSAHLRGYAVDIKIQNSMVAMSMLKAFISAGFNRIGYNSRTKFFHVDCDPSLPQNTFFDY